MIVAQQVAAAELWAGMLKRLMDALSEPPEGVNVQFVHHSVLITYEEFNHEHLSYVTALRKFMGSEYPIQINPYNVVPGTPNNPEWLNQGQASPL